VPETNPVTPADGHTHDPADPATDHDHTIADGSAALPGNPDLRQLRARAKDLRRGAHRGVPADLDLLARHHPRGAALTASPDARAGVTLRDAQLALARSLGFEGWHALVQGVGRRRVEERDMHRWFGVEFNNEVWDLLDAGIGAASPEADRDLVLYGAYASARHWAECGGPAQQARAEHLVARAELAVGHPGVALGHARRCLDMVQAHPDAVSDWDTPFAHEALARALAATGEPEQARRHRELAVRLTAQVVEPLDREVLAAALERGPWFGLDGA
jgi:hypothetical protein